MAGLTGKSTAGVGPDLVNYLTELARYFDVSIRVTSGYRTAASQAQAMFDNWVNLKHGAVYKTSTLPVADRATLDDDWTTAQSPKATAQERARAKADFLKLAQDRVGTKSMHTKGRAVDVSREQINPQVYRALRLRLLEVKEGKRTDIYHFESKRQIPPVDEAMKAQWQAIKDGSTVIPHGHAHSEHGVWC
jgi:hypothetical protein